MLIYIIFAITCGFLSYGMLFAYNQNEWPTIAKIMYREDMGFSMIFGILAVLLPFALVIAFLMSGFAKHGLKFK